MLIKLNITKIKINIFYQTVFAISILIFPKYQYLYFFPFYSFCMDCRYVLSRIILLGNCRRIFNFKLCHISLKNMNCIPSDKIIIKPWLIVKFNFMLFTQLPNYLHASRLTAQPLLISTSRKSQTTYSVEKFSTS